MHPTAISSIRSQRALISLLGLFRSASFSYFKFPSGISLWIQRCSSEPLFSRELHFFSSYHNFCCLYIHARYRFCVYHRTPLSVRTSLSGVLSVFILFLASRPPLLTAWLFFRADTIRPYGGFVELNYIAPCGSSDSSGQPGISSYRPLSGRGLLAHCTASAITSIYTVQP